MRSGRRAFVLAGLAAVGGARAQALAEELDTPFVITPTNVVTAMLDMARVGPGDRLIDLGSGDGRIVLAAAQRGATAVGIEIDGALVLKSRAAARRMKLDDRATFVTQDLFETDFSGYDVVTMYLLPDVNRRLAPKLLALAPGTRVVSHDYGLGDWPPDASIVVDAPDKPVNAEKRSRVMFWRVPARVAARWRGDAGGATVSVDLSQRYQFVSGTVRFAGRDYAIAEQRIDGDRLALAATSSEGATLTLDVTAEQDRIAGAIRPAGGAPIAFAARRG